MSTQPALRRWTYEEFKKLPDDRNRYEVIAGELVVTPSSPGSAHQELLGRLYLLLRPFVDAHALGRVMLPMDVVFGEGDYLIPDLTFVRGDRSGVITSKYVQGAPDLVIEVLSPSTRSRDRGIKRERYAHYGVPEYWVLDPLRCTIEIHRPLESAQRMAILSTGTLEWRPAPEGPVLSIDLDALFRNLE